MKKALMVAGLVVAFGMAASADTIIDFETSEGYTTGPLGGQDEWSLGGGAAATVINTDASSGSQSAAWASGGYFNDSRGLDDTYTVADTVYFSVDVKGGGGGNGGTVYATPRNPENSLPLFEFGFDGTWAGGLYIAGGPGGTIQTTSFPDSDRWVTLWAKVYDGGSGDVRADVGWCELSQTAFVDGLLLSGYDVNDRIFGAIAMTGLGKFDNLVVTLVPPPPRGTIIDFETSEGYTTGPLGGQDLWSLGGGAAATVINTDASSGSQSAAWASGGYFNDSRGLDDTYAVTNTVYFWTDVKGGGGGNGGTIYATPRNPENSLPLFEFGFDGTWAGGLYIAGGPGGTIQTTSFPDSDRWVTLWAKVYDSGGGDVKADVGWCELSQTAFVTGLLLSGYDANDRIFGAIAMTGLGKFDNLRVHLVPPVSPPPEGTLVVIR